MAEPTPSTEPPAPLPWGSIAVALVIAGPVMVGISSFLEWIGRNFPVSYGGFDVPAKFIIDSKANPDGSGLAIGVLVLLIAIIGLVGVFAPSARSNVLVWVSGVAATVVPLLFLVQLNDFMDRFNEVFGPGGFGARNTVGVGAALCGIGGVVTLVGAAIAQFLARND
jgi:hypothetical protein